MKTKQDVLDRAKQLYFSNACNIGIDTCINQALAEAGGISKIVPQNELRDVYNLFDIDENTYLANYEMQLVKEIFEEITNENK